MIFPIVYRDPNILDWKSGNSATFQNLPHAFDASGAFNRGYDTAGAVVHAWRPAHWVTYAWETEAAGGPGEEASGGQRGAARMRSSFGLVVGCSVLCVPLRVCRAERASVERRL